MEVTIRPLQESDAYTSWRWRNDPEIFRYTGKRYNGPVTLQNELDWIHTVMNRKRDYRFAIIADGSYVGNIYLTDVEAGEGTIGIFIGDKTCWNKKVGFKAYALLLHHAFINQQLQSVRSIVRKDNYASIKLHEKSGLKKIGRDDEFIYFRINREDFLNRFQLNYELKQDSTSTLHAERKQDPTSLSTCGAETGPDSALYLRN